MQAAADRIGKKEAHAMTDFVTVRRDALRELIVDTLAFPHARKKLSAERRAAVNSCFEKEVDERLAAMIAAAPAGQQALKDSK